MPFQVSPSELIIPSQLFRWLKPPAKMCRPPAWQWLPRSVAIDFQRLPKPLHKLLANQQPTGPQHFAGGSILRNLGDSP